MQAHMDTNRPDNQSRFFEELQPNSSEHAPEEPRTTPGSEAPSVGPPTRKFKLSWNFAAGFLAWYVVTALIYLSVAGQEALIICSGLLFPVTVIALVAFLRKTPDVGWGMLSALGVNLIVSLVRGLTTNAFCFIPFYIK